MWNNPVDPAAGESKDNEDSRMLHAGLPPRDGLKFGLNCFFNVKPQTEVLEKSPVKESSQMHQMQTPPPVPSLPAPIPPLLPGPTPLLPATGSLNRSPLTGVGA